MFQSTHPRGVRHPVPFMVAKGSLFQSTHPRGVRLCTSCKTKKVMQVSIHAPTRGATFNIKNNRRLKSVSIHAPTRGATLLYHILSDCIRFQSTHPRGVRLITLLCNLCLLCFNPRTHEGCDCIFCKIQNINIQK